MIQRDNWRKSAHALMLAGADPGSEPDFFGVLYGPPIDVTLSLEEQLEQWNRIVEPMAEAALGDSRREVPSGFSG